MRLKIQYSIEENDLLNEVHNIFLKSHEKFNSTKDLVIRQMLHNTTLKEPHKMLSSLESLRNAMISFDSSLEDAMSILEGYIILKNNGYQSASGKDSTKNEMDKVLQKLKSFSNTGQSVDKRDMLKTQNGETTESLEDESDYCGEDGCKEKDESE